MKKSIKQPTVRFYKIKTVYKALVEGKNKTFTKSFVISGYGERDAVKNFYENFGANQYVITELQTLKYMKGENHGR